MEEAIKTETKFLLDSSLSVNETGNEVHQLGGGSVLQFFFIHTVFHFIILPIISLVPM